MMRRIHFLPALLAGVLLAATSHADHDTYLGSVDSIDHVFPAGGGTYTGAVSSTTDDAWIVFAAQAGDVLSFNFRSIGSEYMTAVVLLESENGVVEPGDVADITNFNLDLTGQGTDLVVQHGPLIDGACDGFYCFDTVGGSFSFPAGATGQYVIGVTSANERQALEFEVTLSGNTLNIPEPSAATLLALALLGFVRRRAREA